MAASIPARGLMRPGAAARSAAVAAVMLACAHAPAFMIDVPPEVRTKPADEQASWVRSYMEENYTLQLQEAFKRHGERQGRAVELLQKSAEQAHMRRELIRQMEEENSREMRATTAAMDSGLYATAAFGVFLFLLWWLFYGRPVVVQRRARAVQSQRAGDRAGPQVYMLRTRKQPKAPQAGGKSAPGGKDTGAAS
jgi:hypothetical protein